MPRAGDAREGKARLTRRKKRKVLKRYPKNLLKQNMGMGEAVRLWGGTWFATATRIYSKMFWNCLVLQSVWRIKIAGTGWNYWR